MRTANYTDLRANLKSYIDAVIDDYDTVVINRGNGKGVVMISLDEYNSLKETEYIMSSPDTMEAIHKGEEDIKNGNSISQNEGESIEDFLKRQHVQNNFVRTGTERISILYPKRKQGYLKQNQNLIGRYCRTPIHRNRKTRTA